MHDTNATIRLHVRHPLPPLILPATAFEPLDAATREARVLSFAVSPCGAEESMVLAVWLDAALHSGRVRREQQRCASVPQVVEPDVRQLRPFEDRLVGDMESITLPLRNLKSGWPYWRTPQRGRMASLREGRIGDLVGQDGPCEDER